MNASRFVFDVLPAALSHAIFIEWVDSSLKDMAALDSACCSHACREILHQTWAEMPSSFQKEQSYISNRPSLWKWLHSRRLFICTTVNIDVAYIHGFLDFLPAFSRVTTVFLAKPHRHPYHCPFPSTKPTREDFVRFFQGLLNLQSIVSGMDGRLSHCPAYIWEHVFKATRHMPIAHVSIACDHNLRLIQMLKTHGKTLQSLHLCTIEPIVLQALSAHCPVLEKLQLEGVMSEVLDIVHLTPVLRGLKQLDVYCTLNAAVQPLLPHFVNLEIMMIENLDDFALLPALLQQCPNLQQFITMNFVQLRTNQTAGYDLLLNQQHPSSVHPLSAHLHPSMFPKPVQKLTFEKNSCTSDDAATLLSHFGDTLLTVRFASTALTQELPICKPVLQHVFANCPHLTGLHLERSVDSNDITTIGSIYGQQMRSLTIDFYVRRDGFGEHQLQRLAQVIERCPHLEHLEIHHIPAFPDDLFGRIVQHCPNLATLQIGLLLSDSMIAELIRWRGSRPLLHLSCSNIAHVAARIRQHHKNAGTVNPWTAAGHCWCKEVSCVHRRKAELI